MFAWTAKNRLIDACAREIAADIGKRFPTAEEEKFRKKKSPDKLTRAFEAAVSKARAFQEENRLGIYGKARLLRTLGEELRNSGYSPDFVQSATRALTLQSLHRG